MAAWPGIRVMHACAGDIPKMADFHEGYVVVEANTLEALSSLIAGLPLDVHYARNELSFADEWIHGSFSMRPRSGEREIGFTFWFAGSPLEKQRALLERAVAGLRAVHPGGY
jgi:hypothetical protein